MRNVTTTVKAIDKRDKYYEYVFLGNGLINFISFDHAIQFKDVDNNWKFESLVHDGDSRQGAMIGIVVTHKVNQSIPTISTAKLNASMTLKTSVKFELICGGFPVYREPKYTTTKFFNPND